MELIHTLLVLFRPDRFTEDLTLLVRCLSSLEKSTYKSVVVYNQGFLDNTQLASYIAGFALDIHIIGNAENVGTTLGRQACFDYIKVNFPNTAYVSELHLDMIFAPQWEEPLVSYLQSHDEPLISCGIIDKDGKMPFLEKTTDLPTNFADYPAFLHALREDKILHGFTNPCIHKTAVLYEVGGYDARFLRGKQCFEDDSMLLGYYYYYGTKRDWKPQICFQSIVYHAVAGQRIGLTDSILVNYQGLVRQYGVKGLQTLAKLHKSEWHRQYFTEQFENHIK